MSNDRIRLSTLIQLTTNLKSDLSIIGGLENNLSGNRRSSTPHLREYLDDFPEPGLFCVICQLVGHDQTKCPLNPVVYDEAEGIPVPITTEASRYLARRTDRFAIPRAVAYRLVQASLAIERLYCPNGLSPYRVDSVITQAYKQAVDQASHALSVSSRPPTSKEIINLDHGVLLTLQGFYSAIFDETLLDFAADVATTFTQSHGSNTR